MKRSGAETRSQSKVKREGCVSVPMTVHLYERAFIEAVAYFFSSISVPCFWMKLLAFSATMASIQGNRTSTRT